MLNFGNLLVARERTQAVADSAVLAGAQQEPDTFAGLNTATGYIANYPNTTITNYRDEIQGTTREPQLDAEHPPSGFFRDLLAFFGVNIDAVLHPIEVSASARSQVPLTLNNISPLAIHCDPNCQSDIASGGQPTLWPPDGSTPVTFTYDSTDATHSDFEPIQLPGVSDAADFANFMLCDPLAPSTNCNSSNADSTRTPETSCAPCSPPWYVRLQLIPPPVGNPSLNSQQLQFDLNNARGTPHLVAIYDTPFLVSGSTYFHVIGWAYFQIDSVGTGDDFQITGTFHKLNLDGSYVSSGGVLQDGGNDFGVRAVALSK
jgi:hypothetical protein